MDYAKGENLKVGFGWTIKLEFHGAKVTSDGDLLDYRDQDEALGKKICIKNLEVAIFIYKKDYGEL